MSDDVFVGMCLLVCVGGWDLIILVCYDPEKFFFTLSISRSSSNVSCEMVCLEQCTMKKWVFHNHKTPIKKDAHIFCAEYFAMTQQFNIKNKQGENGTTRKERKTPFHLSIVTNLFKCLKKKCERKVKILFAGFLIILRKITIRPLIAW